MNKNCIADKTVTTQFDGQTLDSCRKMGKLKTEKSKHHITHNKMALFLITVKQNHYANGIELEKGMTVELSSNYSNPVTTNGGHKVQDAFMRNYGLDIKKNNGLSTVYLDVKKIN